MELRALTLYPEWLWVIEHLGKRIENRTRKLPANRVWQPVFLHAGKLVGGGNVKRGLHAVWETANSFGYNCQLFSDRIAFENGKVLSVEKLHKGAIVGVTTFTKCDTIWGEWAASDQYHWHMAHVRFFEKQIPCNGALGFWKAPEDVLEKAYEQLRRR